MAGLVPAIHVFSTRYAVKDVDARHKAGHDELGYPRDHTFSNGTLIALRCSSHSGTGRFLERMKSGLNSFDW
jgi:hypothetical protein